MRSSHGELRRAIVECARSMYQRGLIVAADGNVSVRVGSDQLLITPTAARKGTLVEDDLVLCDLEGVPAPGQRSKPSTEILMHLLAYRARPEIQAVVHAHPPFTIAHSIAGVGLDDPLMPEAFVALGLVPTVPYVTPGTIDVPRALEGPIRGHDVLILARHGSITLGRSLEEAHDRLEVLEHFAKISFYARALAPGRVTGLSSAELAALRVT